MKYSTINIMLLIKAVFMISFDCKGYFGANCTHNMYAIFTYDSSWHRKALQMFHTVCKFNWQCANMAMINVALQTHV